MNAFDIDSLPNHQSQSQSESHQVDYQDLIGDIMKRQDDWSSRRAELDNYLKRLQEAVATENSSFIQSEMGLGPNPSQEEQMSDKMRVKIIRGLDKIKEFDHIIGEKTALSRSLSMQSSRDPRLSLNDETTSVNDDFELRSMNSEDLRTFITEPKFSLKRRKPLVIPALDGEASGIAH
ncbi:hypothetical protein HDU76_007739 [Blyttiomyces sp. JEL0837]|nr:hypothetical protein HDU76_007739 [Blyttiomyces sp. JEL0837]